MWPGSTSPARPKRRRRARGIGATKGLMERIALREGIAPKKTTGESVGACPEHAAELLGFSSAHAFALFCDDLARRRRPRRPRPAPISPLAPATKKPKKKIALPEFIVRLPRWKWKHLPGIVRVLGVRCGPCAGRGCTQCQFAGWGARLTYRPGAKPHQS